MRLLALGVLLLTALTRSAHAADPPGGPGWYQLSQDVTITVSTIGGDLLIAGGTPGFLVGVTATGLLRIRFERGIATWLGKEITSDGGFGATLTVDVEPAMVRAFVRQPLAEATPRMDDASSGRRTGGAEPGALGTIAGTAGGIGGSTVGVRRETTITVGDAQRVIVVPTSSLGQISAGRRGGVEVFPPMLTASDEGGEGRPGRVISREEHDLWLVKVLRLLGEDSAACETKGYGPGWITICKPRGEA